jgi:tetratricopeptide (TPR) repeat protein
MVAGDLVNTASRLQSAAAPGTVLVGEATYRAASNAISFEPAGDQSLKGKATPIPAWRAVAVVATRGGQRRDATLEPPFIGRDDELQQLKDQLDGIIRDGRSRLVTVIGQAGVGKSRLAWEFEKYLDGVVQDVYWHEGRSPAYGEGISYWALAEMVRRRAGIADNEMADSATPKLAATLEEFVPDEAERRWIQPRLAGLLGLSELPADGREELFAAWRTLFVRIAERGPLVMVFSDLHWADQGLLDFIEDLLAWARSSPILALALARPELLERRPTWGSTVRTVTRINLEPLTDAHMQEVLDGLLPGLPEQAAREVAHRAEGIPLYAVEMVRMLLDTAAVVPDGEGRFRMASRLGTLAVPETLQALIAARLDGNLPEDRALLHDASVIGQSFTLEALEAVNGAPAAVLEMQLDRLARRQFVVQDTDPQSPERGQWRFVQGLFREVAYQSLARPDRRSRHLAAARYFEARGEDELAGVLASHYLDAYRNSRPGEEADALAVQARVALQAAADRASALHSYHQAIAYLEQALTVTSDPAELAHIHQRIAMAGEPAGVLGSAIEHAEAARGLYRQVGDGVGALRAGTWLGRLHMMSQQEPTAIASLEEAIAEATALGSVPELGDAQAELARVLMVADHNEEAIAAADRALSVPQLPTVTVVESLVTKGSSLSATGRSIEAEATLRGAIHLADRHGLVAAALRARNNLSGPHSFVSKAEADQLLREGYELARRFGHRPFAHQFLYNMFESTWRGGDWDAWNQERDEVEEAESPSPYYRVGYAGARALRAAMRGDRAEAERQANESIGFSSQLAAAQLGPFHRLVSAWLRLSEGRWTDAVADARAASDNSNFTVEAWWVVGLAAGAGDSRQDLEDALAVLRDPPFRGPVTDALERIVAATLAVRRDPSAGDDHAFGIPHRFLLDNGDLLYGHLGGLLWVGLRSGASPGARAAGEEAATFFAQRGASTFVDTFRARFVPIAQPAAASAPAPHGEDAGTPAATSTTAEELTSR